MPKSLRRRTTDGDTLARRADLLDVQVLDLLAQIEALLRQGRDIQRESLRVRGVRVGTPTVPADAAVRIAKTVTAMQRDTCRSARGCAPCVPVRVATVGQHPSIRRSCSGNSRKFPRRAIWLIRCYALR